MDRKRVLSYIIIAFSMTLIIAAGLMLVQADGVKVEIKKIDEIDVALTTGETEVDFSEFEDDILNSLKERGVNPDVVNIQAFDTTTISTEDTNASEIFNEWESFPYNGPNYWTYDEVNRWITTDFNEPYETGYINKNQGKVSNFKLNADVYITEAIQPLGYVFGMRENPEDEEKWDMYYLWISSDMEERTTMVALFKAEKQNLDFSNRLTLRNTYSATPLRPYNGGYLGWPNHTPYDYGGFPHGTPQQKGITVTNVADPDLKTTLLDFNKIPYTTGWINLELDVNRGAVKASVNNNSLIDHVDTINPYEEGYYGIFAYSHRKPRFQSINSEVKTYREFNEVIRQPEWRDGSKRFVVNMEDNEQAEFDDEHSLGEILTRLTNEKIDYIAVGSDNNRAQADRLINRNSGNGTYINSSSEYNQIINNITDYIVSTLDTSEEEQYVLVDQKTQIEVSPSDILENTENEEYPDGRWRIEHDYDYYENGSGLHELSGKYFSDFHVDFDRPGRYELFFEDNNTFPQYVYSHRQPIASYTMEIEDLTSEYGIKIKDLSYDPDLESTTDKGIKEYDWKWKETASETWNDGEIPTRVPSGKDYIVQLRVLDYQDVWSDPVARYITTSEVVSPPIADFNIPIQSLIYDDVTVNNTSYDPAGRPLTTQEWTVTKSGVEMYRGNAPVTDFSPYGDGRYIVSLRMQNNSGLWSETFSRVIDITKDNVKPVISVSESEVDWVNEDVSINLTFKDDGGSGFDEQRFILSQSKDAPTTGWSSWSDSLTETIRIDKSGVNYLHFEAKDFEGNLAQETFGPYKVDKVKPKLNITSQDREKHEDVIVNLNASDDLSGVKSITLPDGTAITDNNFNYTIESNGVYVFTIEDNAGNKHVVNYEVSDIVRILKLDGPTVESNVVIELQKDMDIELDVGDIVITDWRDNSNNWTLNVVASRLINSDSHILPEGIMSIKGVNVDKIRGDLEGSLSKHFGEAIIDDGSVEIVSGINERGEYEVSFNKNALKFNLPIDIIKKGIYNTKLTWTLESTPAIQ